MRLIECVANISEGRDFDKIKLLASAVSAGGSQLLNVDSGHSANRGVYTFVGSPENICNSAYLLCEAAVQNIDMRYQSGEHPCIGAVDVIPFIPLTDVSFAECQSLAKNFAERIWEELKIPSYLYAQSTPLEKPRQLRELRKNGFKGLAEQTKHPEYYPDVGEKFHQTAGISIVGARNLMLAYNINLDTKSVSLGKRVAKRLKQMRAANFKQAGKSLDSALILAWYLADHDIVQISTNIYDFRECPIEFIFNLVAETAAEIGLKVTGSQVIGMLPLASLISDQQLDYSELAIKLSELENKYNFKEVSSDFKITDRILEFALQKNLALHRNLWVKVA